MTYYSVYYEGGYSDIVAEEAMNLAVEEMQGLPEYSVKREVSISWTCNGPSLLGLSQFHASTLKPVQQLKCYLKLLEAYPSGSFTGTGSI